MTLLDVRRGRPRKFSRPARTITLTLPDDVIDQLSRFDPDIGRAVVRLALAHHPRSAASAVEIVSFGSRAVILVPPARRLAGLPGVELVPFADGRALIALDEHVNEEAFELMVRDTLDDGSLPAKDRDLFTALARLLREARLDTRVTLRRILVLRARTSPRRAAPPTPAR